jgi:hypothetical protein
MSKLTVPAAQDIVRLVGPTDLATKQNLFSFFTDPSAGFFSYRVAHGLCRHAFAHTVPLEQILAGCDRIRHPQGVSSNVEVLRLLWAVTQKRSVTTFELPVKRLMLRKDLSIRVAPPFAFVENGRPSVFWFQPRKGHALSFSEIAFLASILKATYLVDDYEGVGFEICDLSAPDGKNRDPRVYTLTDFDLLPEAEVLERLQRFARAFDLLRAEGIEPRKRKPKEKPTEPDIFD